MLSVVAVATTAVTVEFKSGTTSISCVFPVGATGGFVLPHNDYGWFETNENQDLRVNLGNATPVGIQINYILV